MKLKNLALIACCMAMPALASAQEPMKMGHDSTMKMDSSKGKSQGDHGKRTRARGSRRSARGMEMNHSRMNMTPGAACARGCPTSSGTAGLTGPQFLALQQELRDRGCGNNHVTGVLDAPTRAAIRSCAAKWGVAATPAAVLNKMNIGYTVGG